jgi:nickel transport protein
MKNLTRLIVATTIGLTGATAAGAHGFWFADADGNEVPSKLTPTGPIVLVDVSANPSFLAATMDYGTWSKAPDGEWYEKGKDEVPNAIVSEKNYKYGVNIRGKLTKPVPLLPKQRLQVVPVDAVPEKMGQPIKLKVYFEGKPAAGARVMSDWINDPDAKGVKTAKDGTATIKVRNQGLNVIVAIFETKPEDPSKTNTVEHLATLSFVLPHEPE